MHVTLAVASPGLAGARSTPEGSAESIDGETIAGGITYELYPTSRCGFLTYMVVAPAARRHGLGRELLETATAALYASRAIAVFGEVNDPCVHGEAARPRLDRFERWGARVLDVGYVQPRLGEGLERDRGLCLIALPRPNGGLPDLAAATVRGFVSELFAVTEQRAPDAELHSVLDRITEPVQFRASHMQR
jgi:GNAT superfamily N-acetyltransferase